MNKEDIIRMAREAGFRVNTTESLLEELERFAALVASAERSACAGIAEEWSKRPDDVGGYIYRNIRARGSHD